MGICRCATRDLRARQLGMHLNSERLEDFALAIEIALGDELDDVLRRYHVAEVWGIDRVTDKLNKVLAMACRGQLPTEEQREFANHYIAATGGRGVRVFTARRTLRGQCVDPFFRRHLDSLRRNVRGPAPARLQADRHSGRPKSEKEWVECLRRALLLIAIDRSGGAVSSQALADARALKASAPRKLLRLARY